MTNDICKTDAGSLFRGDAVDNACPEQSQVGYGPASTCNSCASAKGEGRCTTEDEARGVSEADRCIPQTMIGGGSGRYSHTAWMNISRSRDRTASSSTMA